MGRGPTDSSCSIGYLPMIVWGYIDPDLVKAPSVPTVDFSIWLQLPRREDSQWLEYGSLQYLSTWVAGMARVHTWGHEALQIQWCSEYWMRLSPSLSHMSPQYCYPLMGDLCQSIWPVQSAGSPKAQFSMLALSYHMQHYYCLDYPCQQPS